MSIGSRFREVVRWLGQQELFTLATVLLIAGGIWGFVVIADEVREGETLSLDTKILLALRNPADQTDPLGPLWFEDTVRDLTALGGIPVLILLTLSVVGFLVLQRKYRVALLILVAVLGGLILSSLLKYGFSRPRPDLVPHGSYVLTSSFPSGHSMLSAVTYLTLGGMLTRIVARRRVKAYVLGMALLMTLLVGCSRIYLGVHWPTDVLAGWAAGATWALICSAVARWLQQRNQLEKEG